MMIDMCSFPSAPLVFELGRKFSLASGG